LTVSVLSNAKNGNLILNADGTFKYTHNDNEIFTDSFSYVVSDMVSHKDTAWVHITINPINDNIPNAIDDSYTVSEDGTKNVGQKVS